MFNPSFPWIIYACRFYWFFWFPLDFGTSDFAFNNSTMLGVIFSAKLHVCSIFERFIIKLNILNDKIKSKVWFSLNDLLSRSHSQYVNVWSCWRLEMQFQTTHFFSSELLDDLYILFKNVHSDGTKVTFLWMCTSKMM